MATIQVKYSNHKPGKITKWKVTHNTMVAAGRILLVYDEVNGEKDKKLKATQYGRISNIIKKTNEEIQPNEVILIMEGCKHPTVMKDLCAECGADLREDSPTNIDSTVTSQASVPMVHCIPELKVCPELAEKIGKEDEQRLLIDKKLVLLVDLDQTIVHTTNDQVPANMKDVYHFQLYGPNSPWYHTRLRPHTRTFLEEMSKYYELHICTFGARNYAHKVASILDNDGKLFSHRILSRDECFDSLSKTANLRALFPCGVDMVCIIDDREDVWQGCGNLVQVKPYHFFKHTGDINAPPGLEKQENDSRSAYSTEMLGSDEESDNKNGVLKKNSDKVDSSIDKKIGKDICEKDKKNNGVAEPGVTALSEKQTIKDFSENNQTVCEANEKGGSENEKQDQLDAAKSENIQNAYDEDPDDYLLYLEDILKRIHSEYYRDIEKEKPNYKRSLKNIIPKVRSKVLQDVCITFSGLIPNHQKIEQSRAYKVARAFGAKVSQELTEDTTHLVAIQLGTAKVNTAKREGKVKIVNPDWLWTCAERWEHVDERLDSFSVKQIRGSSRIPPPHCSSPATVEIEPQTSTDSSHLSPESTFFGLSREDIDIMDKEVDEDMSDQDDEDNDLDLNEESQSQDAVPKGYFTEGYEREQDDDSHFNYFDEDSEPPNKKSRKDTDNESNSDGDDDDDEDDPVTRFRRGGDLPDNLDLGDNSQDDCSIEDLDGGDLEDDSEWNAMGSALEREFLSE